MDIVINIFMALGISIGINLFFFLLAYFWKSDVFTDITYASTFLVLNIILFLIFKNYGLSQILTLVLVGLWAIRLGSYLLIRIIKTKVDHRFDKMRNSFWKFGAFWFFQGCIAWVVNMPAYFNYSFNSKFSYFAFIPLLLAFFFLIFETIADLQKWFFVSKNKNKGQFFQKGLWSISRHPNYFGEYMFWWCFWVFCLVANYNHLAFIGVLGPFFITFILYKMSGLPLTEKETFKLFGKMPEYHLYLNKTATIIPWLGKKGIKKQWKT